MISLASSGPPPNLEDEYKKDKLGCVKLPLLITSYFPAALFQILTCGRYSRVSSPLHWVFLKKAREQGARLRSECARKTNVFHEDEFKQLLVVLVVERQSATHHLVHHHPQTPPVHSTAVVVVF